MIDETATLKRYRNRIHPLCRGTHESKKLSYTYSVFVLLSQCSCSDRGTDHPGKSAQPDAGAPLGAF
jgi:hypothetical protein